MTHFQKIIETTIILSNPIDSCINLRKYVEISLNNKYVNKCFSGGLIFGFTKILDISEVEIINSNDSGNGQVNVRFIADMYRANKWDIITNIKVVNSLKNIIGVNDNNSIIISVLESKQNESIKVGQKICVRVNVAIHTPFTKQISAGCSLLVCDTSFIEYSVDELLTMKIVNDIRPMYEKILVLLNRRNELDMNRILFFESLLYSYKLYDSDNKKMNIENKNLKYKWVGPSYSRIQNKTINILDIIEEILNTEKEIKFSGIYARELGIYRSSPLINELPLPIASVDNKKVNDLLSPLVDDNKIIVKESLLTVMTIFLKNILDNLNAINEMIQIYNDEDIKSHSNIWDIMRYTQLV